MSDERNPEVCVVTHPLGAAGENATRTLLKLLSAIRTPEWIETLVKTYETTDAHAVGGRLDPKWLVGRPSFLPEESYWLVGVTHRGFADGPGEVRNTFGSNISFRADVFAELGGFDVDIGGRKGDKNLQGGETELCARMREVYEQGVWYDPEAEVAHKVFEYRTEFWWLVDRAFWQGYSKRAMKDLLPETGDEEGEFLFRIVTKSVPKKCKLDIMNMSVDKMKQLLLLWLFTIAVGFGYPHGIARYWGDEQ